MLRDTKVSTHASTSVVQGINNQMTGSTLPINSDPLPPFIRLVVINPPQIAYPS